MHSQHPVTRCCYIFMRCQDFDLEDLVTYFSMAVGVFKLLICIQPHIYICSIFLLDISVSIGCTAHQTAYSKHMYQGSCLTHPSTPQLQFWFLQLAGKYGLSPYLGFGSISNQLVSIGCELGAFLTFQYICVLLLITQHNVMLFTKYHLPLPNKYLFYVT